MEKKPNAPDTSRSTSGAESEPGCLRRVIVYVGSDPKRDSSMFYLSLFWSLMKQGQEQGIEMVPLIETRPASMAVIEPPEVARIRREGPVDGVIGFMVYPAMTTWMREAGLSWTVFCQGKGIGFVDMDHRAMIREALERLAARGCRSAGLMIPSDMADAAMLEHVENVCAKTGLEVNYEWIFATRVSQEPNGYSQLCALWERTPRPDGLIVFPDRAARGVLSAIMEKRVRVPEELRLVLHRNAESPYVSPVPCDWAEVNVAELARLLLDNLREVIAGRATGPRLLKMRLIAE